MSAGAGHRAGTVPWLLAVAACVALAGLGLGAARLAAIDGRALRAAPGREVTATGVVVGVPRYDDGTVELPVKTAEGRLLVRARGTVGELSVGDGVRASGRTARPQPWREGWLRRLGVITVLEARVIHPTGRRRAGLEGLLDGVRERAESALERGMPPSEAALARGFVLGQDDRIDPRTVEEFKRSGLAHLLRCFVLAISGDQGAVGRASGSAWIRQHRAAANRAKRQSGGFRSDDAGAH